MENQDKNQEQKQNEEQKKSIPKWVFGVIMLVGVFLFVISLFIQSIPLIISGGAIFLIGFISYIIYFLHPVKTYIELEKTKENLKKMADDTEARKLSLIKKTHVISHDTITDKESAKKRGIIGMALAGTSGAIIGAATAKEIKTTTFLVEYEMIFSQEAKEVQDGSELYNIYIQHLEM